MPVVSHTLFFRIHTGVFLTLVLALAVVTTFLMSLVNMAN